jgi:pimeloyl-ACP methyl ester carboxylesterase
METGSARRDTLILVPGLLCDAMVWRSQMAALRDLVDVAVAEHGAQDSLPGMAQTILATAPPRFALAGHSMGGRIALEVMRAAPARVTGLALLDTGYSELPVGEAGEREAERRYELLDLARREGMRAMGFRWVQGMVHPSRLADRGLIDAILDMFEAKTPEVFAAQVRALLERPDASSVLGTIACPTLVLCGCEDSWSPVERHREIAALIPHSTLVAISECGHMSTVERPQAVSDAFRAWLESIGAATRADEGGRRRLADPLPV